MNLHVGMVLSLALIKSSSLKFKFKTHAQPKCKAVSSVTKKMYDCIVPLQVILYFKLFVTFTIHKILVKQSRSLMKDLMGIMKLDFAILKSHILSKHFDFKLSKGGTCKIQIQEKLDGIWYTTWEALDASCSHYRKELESLWIKQWRAAYPYGVNVDLEDGMTKDIQVMVDKHLFSLNRTMCYWSRGTTN